MEKTSTHSKVSVSTYFRSDHSCQDCNFLRVEQYILAIAGPEMKSSQSPDKLSAHIVDSKVEDDLFTFIYNDSSDFLGDLVYHFLYSGRVDSSILDQTFKGHSGYFLSYRVEA